MCVYHYADSKRAECFIVLFLFGAIVFSLGASLCMFILIYPGDECLLFVSVRGEALIYGNPAGCNFIGFGHIPLILIGILKKYTVRAQLLPAVSIIFPFYNMSSFL